MAEVNPLFSQDAEKAFLGALLIDPGEILTVDITEDDLYVQRHKTIYSAMARLAHERITPDMITLTNELERDGSLDMVGGLAYLVELTAFVPTSLNLPDYVQVIQDKARRRALVGVARNLAKAAYGADAPDEAVMKSITQLTANIRHTAGAHPLTDYINSLYEVVQRAYQNPKDIYGLPTGLNDFDRITGGLQQGEAFYIGGEPGIGKSILSVQMGIGMAENGAPGAIYSLEMRGIQVTRRIVSGLGRIETAHLKTGRLDADEWDAFVRASERAARLPVYMSDEAFVTTASLRADLARLVAQHDIRWFVLDYLYLLSDGSGTMEPTARTELLSSRVKLLCKEFNLAGITVNSVTKDGGDIRGSGQVKHDADIIAMLMEHQPDLSTGNQKRDNMRTLVFRKGREMAQPKAYMHLVKNDKYPLFGDFQRGIQ